MIAGASGQYTSHFIVLSRLALCAYSLCFTSLINADTSSASNDSTLSREEWHSKLNWETSACPIESPNASNSGISVHDAGNGSDIIEVECEKSAYQGTYLLYLRRNEAIVPLNFKQFESPDIGQLKPYQSPLVTGLPSINKNQALFVLRKYRGLGDCGQYLQYEIKADQVSLKKLRVNECTDTLSQKPKAPNSWPLRKLQ